MARLIKHLILLVAASLVGVALVAPPAGAKPTWQPVTNLFADLSAVGGSAQTPAVAVDAGGNATAIWSRYDGTQVVVQASTRPAGGSWAAPVDLTAGRIVFNPQLAVDPGGNVTAVWRRRDASTSVVQAATRPIGGAWTTPVDLSTDQSIDISQQPDLPQVAADATGVFTVTWSRYEANKYTVQSASRLTDGTWTTPVDLSVPGQSARTTDLAVDPAGNATAIWVNGVLVQAATRPAGGAWGAPVDLSTAAGPRSNPRIVVDPAGTATAVWGSFTTTYGIQTATRPIGGTWTAAAYLSAPGEDTFDTPQIAVDRQGAATAVWQRHDGSGWIVTSATRPAGGSWTASVDLSVKDRDGWDPQVAVDPLGNATAIWSLSDVSGRASNNLRTIQASRRPAGGSWSEPVDLTEGGDAWNPQIAFDPAGNATTAWSRQDGTNWIVQARGLDAAGPVVTALSGQAANAGRRTFSVKAYDVWSRVASAVWTFHDGTTASGTSVTGDGTGPAKVTLTDAVGNATVCTYTGTYSCRSTTRVAPLITKVALSRHTIRTAGSDSTVAKKARATVVLTTDAKVTLVFKKAGTKTSVRLTKRLEAGRNAVIIRARLAPRKTLQPGRYVILVKAANKAGTSPKQRLRLRVVR